MTARLFAATGAPAAALLAVLLPAAVRPPIVPWVAGTALLAAAVVTLPRRYGWAAGLVAAATALGAITQLRLGAASPTKLAALAAAAAGLLIIMFRVGASIAVRGEIIRSGTARLAAAGCLSAALLLRLAPVFGPHAATGTLPLFPFQVGEFTRLLVVVGVAAGMATLQAPLRPSLDGRFVCILAALLAANVAVLVWVKDLGPATLVVLGAATAVIHVRGLQLRWLLRASALGALAAPLLWTSSVLRERVRDIVHPSFQLHEALLAANSGGLIGPGPGRSALAGAVPAGASDYAVAVLTADLGSAVVLPVILALLATYTVVVHAAARLGGLRGTLAVSVMATLLCQAAWNALATLGILPLTGLNQPFLGLSGSSLIACAAGIGLCLGLVDNVDPASATSPVTRLPPRGELAIRAASRAGLTVVAVLLVAAASVLVFRQPHVGDQQQTVLARGAIWTRDGHLVAVDDGGRRIYPAGDLYADLGYMRKGFTQRGLEAVRADTLTCAGQRTVLDWFVAMLHPTCKPADIVTTVDSAVQAHLAAALRHLDAEAVVVDSRDSSVLGLYSGSATKLGNPSTARLRQGPPGSTMKLITAAAAELDKVDFSGAPRTVLYLGAQQSLHNDFEEACPSNDVETALAYSCNSVLGWASTQVGAANLHAVGKTYFGTDQPFHLAGGDAAGLDTGITSATNGGALARTGIGQESVRSSVLGIALATEVIVNGDFRATKWPSLTAAVCTGDDGITVPTPTAAIGSKLPGPVADSIYAGMKLAASEGTARNLDAGSHDVAAKTGTADVSDGSFDSWITVIVDKRYVLTLTVHHPASDSAAVTAASTILQGLQLTNPAPSCTRSTRSR